MKQSFKWLFAAGTGALALALAATGASAQLDHLACYKAVDKLAVTAAFDLFAELQPEFTAKGCSIVKVEDFCVPATKLNVQPTTSDVRADIAGPALSVDYIGYLLRCKQEITPPSKVVIDQFGTHRQGRYKLYKVYVPAKKGPPPCGTVGGKACGGVCPDATDECRVDTDGVCKCIPPTDNACDGKPDKQGMCGGPCPNATDECQVVLSTTGMKTCGCGPPPPPRCGLNLANGQCGGTCPNPADKCAMNTAKECLCEPATTPCAMQPGTVPTCGGDCPIAGDVCQLDSTNNCTCGAPPPTPCGQNAVSGTCSGDCTTPGETCALDATGKCSCGLPPCASDANGQCGGVCPTGTTCELDATGACNCNPPPCGNRNGQCGGFCAAPTTCVNADTSGGIVCKCQ